jgi:hypothetical protein
MADTSSAASPSRTPHKVGGHVRSDVLCGSSSRATNDDTRFARNATAQKLCACDNIRRRLRELGNNPSAVITAKPFTVPSASRLRIKKCSAAPATIPAANVLITGRIGRPRSSIAIFFVVRNWTAHSVASSYDLPVDGGNERIAHAAIPPRAKYACYQ